MNTPNLPFHRDLAEKAKWPLVTRDGRKAEVLKWDVRSEHPMIGLISNVLCDVGVCWYPNGNFSPNAENEHPDDLFLSTDYTDPLVRAAVQRAHEELGMEVMLNARDNGGVGDKGTISSDLSEPSWRWEVLDFRLAIHLPAPVAPSEPKKAPYVWCQELGLVGFGVKDWEAPITKAEFQRMVKPDPYAELKAAHAAGKTIQYKVFKLFGNFAWEDRPNPDWSLPPDHYRIKPWSLSRQIPGFRALRDGEEWHRGKEYIESDLPQGTRPFLIGEKTHEGCWCEDSGMWQIFRHGRYATEVSDSKQMKFRTTRPLPEPLTLLDMTKEDFEAVRGLEFKNPEGDGIIYRIFWEAEDAIIFSVSPRANLHKYYSELRAQGWLYRGNGMGWQKCQKEGE
jgi:hypothetical protein